MKNLLAFIILVFLVTTCTEEEIGFDAYPHVRTSAVSSITSGGALFRGEITSSSVEIIDHGFVWSTSQNPRLEGDELFSLGRKTSKGGFEQLIERSLMEGKKYYVKAYAKSKDYTVYGDVVEFISLGSKAPKIISVQPAIGTWKDTVTITGKDFSSFLKNNEVKFDTLAAKIIESSATSILCIVPEQLAKEFSNVSVAVVGNESVLENSFQLIHPTIISIDPTLGLVSTDVTILGDFFSRDHSKVFFNSTESLVSEISTKKIVCKVPPGLPEGEVILKVLTGDGNLHDEIPFISKKPKIIEIAPLQATYYDIITITGESFVPDINFNKVKFGNVYFQVISVTSTEIKVQVPGDLEVPSFQISLEYGVEKIVTDKIFTLLPPEIISVDPLRTLFDTEITITGKNFSPFKTTVIIGNQTVEPLSVSTTEIKVLMPYSSTSHNNTLTVVASNQSVVFSQMISSPWIQVGNIDASLNYPVKSLVVQDKIFLIASNQNNYSATNFLEFDEVDEVWIQKDFPAFGYDYGQTSFSFSIGDKAYFGAGLKTQVNEEPDYTYDLWEYDTSNEQWNQKNPVPRQVVNAVGFSINGKGYFVGGQTPEGLNSSEVWEYDPQTDDWTRKADIPDVIDILNTRTFVFDNSFYEINNFQSMSKYNPISDTWSRLPDFQYQFLFEIGGKIYSKENGLSGTLMIYDLLTETWTQKDEFSASWQPDIVFSRDNSGYFFEYSSCEVWEFDPNE